MSRKLALYFLGKGDQQRILDAEHQPIHGSVHGWVVGRTPAADLCFKDSLVSKRHALITATLGADTTEGGTPIYVWAVRDLGSTNGTYLTQQRRKPYRLGPDVGYTLAEQDLLQFGSTTARVRASFDIDDTLSPDYDELEPPTNSGPSPSATAGSNSPWYVPAILEPVWLWFTAKGSVEQFFFLLVIGGLAALLLYIWRM